MPGNPLGTSGTDPRHYRVHDAERRRLSVRDLVFRAGLTQDLAVSVITLAEFKHGVRRADTPLRATLRQQFLDDILSTFVVLDITPSIALRAGDLEAELEMRGEKLAINDILIAATALQYGHTVITRNLDHFTRIQGLQVLPQL